MTLTCIVSINPPLSDTPTESFSTDESVVLQIRSYITTLDPQLAETQQWKRKCSAAISARKGVSNSRTDNVAAAREGQIGNAETVTGLHMQVEVIECCMCPPSSVDPCR